MKKPLQNAATYFVIAAVFYIALLALPESIAFYGGLLFFVIHLPGVALIGLFTVFVYSSTHSLGEASASERLVLPLILITVNAAVVFLLDWTRTKR